ncbi:hypothetical protein [Nitrospirillum amazonense]|uniref:hypothetical protein n=1 Tax=Nitrospirillum amazonense TaxID=28077 RepID=UPI002412BF38|nr:hypothetical protein [Nitrospirillum amazonense]MDG3444526.1 hypothetical protein [Nitrospirillum amazonense]
MNVRIVAVGMLVACYIANSLVGTALLRWYATHGQFYVSVLNLQTQVPAIAAASGANALAAAIPCLFLGGVSLLLASVGWPVIEMTVSHFLHRAGRAGHWFYAPWTAHYTASRLRGIAIRISIFAACTGIWLLLSMIWQIVDPLRP